MPSYSAQPLEEPVIIGMTADPKPNDGIVFHRTDCPVVQTDPTE